MFAIERRQAIVSITAKENSITVSELSKRLGVSVVTIRKDLEALEADGLVTRTYGGVILKNGQGEENPAPKPEYPQLIQEAAKLILPGQTIMLGSGKNIAALADYIKETVDNLTVITFSIEVALALVRAPHIDVILTGGILRSRTMSLLGYLAERVIKEICFDLSFSEVDGIHPLNGITSANLVESSTEAVLYNFSARPVILAEAGAVGRTAPALISGLKPGMTIIVNGRPDQAIIEQLKQKGLKITLTGQ